MANFQSPFSFVEQGFCFSCSWSRPVARIFCVKGGGGGATEAKVDPTIEMKAKKSGLLLGLFYGELGGGGRGVRRRRKWTRRWKCISSSAPMKIKATGVERKRVFS